MKVFASFLLLLSGLSGRVAFSNSPEQQIEQHFRRGQQALQQADFAQAAEEFKKVLAVDPTIIEADINLGLAYQGLLQYDLAVQSLTRALKERPSLPGPTLIVGLDYLKLGKPAKAIPYLEQSVKLDPSNRYAREALASSYLSQDNFRAAAEQFRLISISNPDQDEALFRLGHQYLDLAARLAFRGARTYPDSPWGHRFLGDLLFQRDRWADAAKEYQKAVAIEPRQPGLHTSIGQSYLHLHKLDEAESEFHRELELDPRSEPTLLGWANLQLLKNQPKEAVAAVQKAWQASPEFLALQREFPSVELPRELLKAQIETIRNEQEGPAKRYLLAALSVAADDTRDADQAWKTFQSDVVADKQHSGVRTKEDPCVARRYSQCIDATQARPSLTNADRLTLGKTYFALQQYEKAANTLEQIQEVQGKDSGAAYWLERSYQALGALTYAKLEEASPASWRSRQLHAEGYAFRGNVDEAIKEYQAALEIRPNEAELHESLGELYLDHQTYDAARNELEKALALDGSRAHSLYLLGRVYVEQRENGKAVPYLERALRLQPDMTEGNNLLGTAYMRLGQTADAVPRLERAAGADHYGNVHYQLYIAYRKLGQQDRAQKELQRSQDLRKNALERDQALVMGSPQTGSEPQ